MRTLGIVSALSLLATTPVFAHDHGGNSFSLNDFAAYMGTYSLHHVHHGQCPESINVGFGGLGGLGKEQQGQGEAGVLSIGGYEFRGLNEGWQSYRSSSAETWTNSRLSFSLFGRMPILRTEMKRYYYSRHDGRKWDHQEVKVEAKRNGILEVRIEKESHVRGRNPRFHAECDYIKAGDESGEDIGKGQGNDQGQGKNQGKDQGQGKDLGNNGQGQGETTPASEKDQGKNLGK